MMIGVLAGVSAAYMMIVGAITFLHHQQCDEGLVVGSKSAIYITGAPDELTKSDFIDTISRVAVDERINIYKPAPDPGRADTGRILFVFAGNESTLVGNSVTGAYPSFSQSYSTGVRPASEITTQSMRGLYTSDADSAVMHRVLAQLAQRGIVADFESVPTNLFVFLTGIVSNRAPIGAVLAVTLLALFLGAVTFASARSSVATVRIIHGYSPFLAGVREFTAAVAVFGGTAAVMLIFGVIALFFYNGLNQFDSVFATGLTFTGLGFLAVLIGQLSVRTVIGRYSLSSVLKGRRPLALLAGLAAVIQVIALLIVFPTISDTVQMRSTLDRDSRLDEKWRASRGAVSVQFAGTNTPKDFDAIEQTFNEIAKDEEAHGRMILSDPPMVQVDEVSGHGPREGNSLIVNNRYLDMHALVSKSGERIVRLDEADGIIYILVPEKLRDHAAELTTEYEQWAEFRRSVGSIVDGPRSPVEAKVIEMAPDQEVFNYGANPFQGRPVQNDPVVAVIPARANVLSSDFYLAAASNAGVIFTDADIVREVFARTGIDKYVSSISDVSDSALVQRAKRVSVFQLLNASVVLVFLALLLSAAILAWTYCQRERQRICVEFVHGRSFASVHGRFFLWMGGIGTALLAGSATFGWVVSSSAFALCFICLGVLVGGAGLLVATTGQVSRSEDLARL